MHETTEHSPASVLFSRQLRLSWDHKFGYRPEEELAEDDYVSNLHRKMDYIHDWEKASDKMRNQYDI